MQIPLHVSEIEIKYTSPALFLKTKISDSRSVLNILKAIWDENTIGYQESFIALFLNRANYVLGYRWISTGGTCGTVVDPKHLFGIAVKSNSCSIILGHNHPSGRLNPSQADIALTKKLKEGGEYLNVSILDHLIINPQFEYYSFADEGII